MDIIWRVISWEEEGGELGQMCKIKKHNWYVQNRQGEVKNSIGNGEAKELICTTHGHELREELLEGRWVPGGGGKGGKIWKAVIT